MHGIRHYRPNVDNEAILAKWRQVSKRRAPTAAISDYANPVFYITSPDLVQWEKDVKTAVDDIHQRFPNKKIIGYIWPQYYSATNSPYFKQFINPVRWRKMLEISKKYTDGVIIWSDKRDKKTTKSCAGTIRASTTMKATQAFINANAKEIKVEGLQKY